MNAASGWSTLLSWRYRRTVLALCTLAFFVTMVGRLAISPVVPAITEEFGVSNAVLGAVLTGMWLAYGLSQFPSGVVATRYGERPVILVAIGGTVLTSMVLATSPSLLVFLVAAIALGSVAGLHFSVATTLLSRTFDEVGTAVGIHNSGGTVAGLLTPVAVAWIAVQFGWRAGLLLAVTIGIPAFLLFAWRVRPTTAASRTVSMRDQLSVEFAVDLLSRPSLVFSLFVATTANFVWQGTASFLPTFLIEYRGYSTAIAGVLFSGYFVVQVVAQIVVGAVTDRAGRDRTAAACLSIGAVGFAVLAASPGTASVVTGIFLIGVGMSYGPPVITRLLAQLSDVEQTAGFGFSRTVYMTLASTGSVVVGVVADLLGWGTSFAVLGALLTLVVLLLATNWALELGY